MGTSPYSTTLDDNSPLISYSDFPATTVSCIDPQNCPYGSTLHQTATPGASATFSFTGTGLCIYGTRGPQYGVFNISIDDATQQGSAQAATAQYSQALWCQVGLMQGSHQVVLTNGDRELAFDYAVAAQNGEWPESGESRASKPERGNNFPWSHRQVTPDYFGGCACVRQPQKVPLQVQTVAQSQLESYSVLYSL